MKFITLRLKFFLLTFAFVAVLVASTAVAYAVDAAAVYWSGARALPIYSVERSDNKIAISFDCAWGTEHTDEILKNLKNAGIKATFFTVQFWAEKYPDYLKKIDEAGHEIGTHSATHSYMSKLSQSEIERELTASSQAIEKVTGKTVELFRPPYGDYDDLLIQTCERQGLYPIQWDVDSLDWKNLSASDIAQRICSKTRSGSIILCHNNGLHTAEALPILIDNLRAKGLEFVTIGELIYRENYTMDHTGRQIPKGVA